MTVGVNPPKTPVTKGSNGMATATLPNICKMPPPPPPFAPTPLPNIGQSGKQPQDYSTTVKIEGQPVAIRGSMFGSTGDIASKATGGGVVSSNAEGPTKFIAPGSLNVQIEGKNVQLLGDQTLNNCGPTGMPANSATMTGTIQMASLPPMPGLGTPETCPNCKQANGKNESEAEPYDKFFSPEEQAEFDAIAKEHPDLEPMLPPKNALFQAVSEERNEKARARWTEKKKKAKMKGTYHHPHSLGTGGCPVHQELVKKPDQEPEKTRVDAVDVQIKNITDRATNRHR